jgi:hypothetical protein
LSTPKDNVIPSGVIDGVNKTFTLPEIPIVNSQHIYRNGQRIKVGLDYTISLNTITMINAPMTAVQSGNAINDWLLVDYMV